MTQERLDRMRRLIVVLACAFNVAAVAATNAPVHTLIRRALLGLPNTFGPVDIDHYDIVNNAIWLAPTLAIILLRQYIIAAILYALVLLPVLLGRIYYVLPNVWTGDSGSHPKGDPAVWAQTWIAFGSLMVIAVLALLQVVTFIQNLTDRKTGRA